MRTPRPHPFDVIARVLAERLHGCAPSEGLRALVGSPGIAWVRVVRRASAEFVLPAFAAALRDLELIGSLEEELRAFLLAVHAANVERNDELRRELATAVKILNRAGIEPVLLKGAIRLVDGLYPDPGWRMLRDLDLLLPEEEVAAARRALDGAGYAPCADAVRRKDGPCQIDLHQGSLSEPTRRRPMPAQSILSGSRPWAIGGGKVRVPAIEHQLAHLIGHGQIRHRGHAIGRIGLRDRLEAAALVRWGQGAIDWQALSARFIAAGCRRPLLAFLLALNDGAWCAVPVPGRIDPLTALQQRRIALQARSATFDHVGSWIGGWASELGSQISERDAGQRRALKNLKRLLFERGAMSQMARSLAARQRHLM